MSRVEIDSSGMRRIIGITGGIGAGKSVVSRILRHQGYAVYDCDTEARRLMEGAPDVKDALRGLLGRDVYRADGTLDRGMVSRKIFNDSGLLSGVNAIVHTAVKNDFKEWCGDHGGTVFVESAILATSGMDSLCSEIWIVDAPEDIRIDRVRERNGLSEEEIRSRMRTQTAEIGLIPSEKTVYIDNGGNASLIHQITNLIKPEK